MDDWATLPTGVLTLVVQHLVYMEDFFSFGVVCKSWNSITSRSMKVPVLPPKFPLIMLPVPKSSIPGEESIPTEEHQYSSRRKFYSLSALQNYEIKLPEATGRNSLGTFNGWLLTVDDRFNVNLLRPIPRQRTGQIERIALPRLFSFKEPVPHEQVINLNSCVVKVAMSGNPQNANNPMEKCVVVAIARDHPFLAYTRIGDQVWTMCSRPRNSVYYDVAYYKGAFHAMTKYGVLFMCDVPDDKIAPKVITAPIAPPQGCTKICLIESSGDLLLVHRFNVRRRKRSVSQNSYRRSAVGFTVYKLEEVRGIEEYPYKWTEVRNLRGRTLFLGGDVSVSSCSSKRAKPDCIYFSEDDPEKYPGDWDTRVYNMRNDIVEVLYHSPY